MASKCFTFTSLAEYQSARAGNIKNILNAAAPSVTCISTVTSTGETFIDSMNTIVPRNKGAIGDLLVYKNDTYYWVKTTNAYPEHNAYVSAPYSTSTIDSTMTSIVSYGGSMYHIGKLTSAGYTCVGFMGYKEGDRCLILSMYDIGGGGIYWSPQTGTDASGNVVVGYGCGTDTALTIRNNSLTSWIASCSKWYSYKYAKHTLASNYRYVYTYPLAEEFWNAVHKKYLEGTNVTNGTIPRSTAGYSYELMTYTINFPNVTISFTGKGNNSTYTINPLDYNWNFDNWYRQEIMYSKYTHISSDMNGERNTRAIVKQFGTGADYAAKRAINHGVSGVPEFEVGNWWLPSCGELCRVFENGEILDKAYVIPWGGNYYWTSSQCNGSYAWRCSADAGTCRNGARTDALRVRAAAAFVLSP